MSELASDHIAKRNPAISERAEVAVTHLAARRGMRESLASAARAAFGVDLPSTPRAVEAGSVMIVWAGPDQWLIIEPQRAGADPSVQHAKTFNGLASVLDVSDSRAIFRVRASYPSEVLVRNMGIDFEDTSFKPGDVAITHVSHLGVMTWRLPDGSGYDFACPRTYSRDFLSWLGKIV